MNNCGCGRNNCSGSQDEKCFESRLSLGINQDKSAIVGSLDRQSIKPIALRPAVQANETITSLKYDPDKKALVYNNERAQREGGTPDYIESREVLSGALISQLGGVGNLVDGGIATVAIVDGELKLLFNVPTPIEVGETAGGFITYVVDPNDGISHLKTIRPDSNGVDDSVLLGKADGSLEFSTPITSPILMPVAGLTSNGAFSGTPGVASGTWRYQAMGTSPVISNTSGGKVEVTLRFRFSLVTAGGHSGVYCSLVNGGSDYQALFPEGVNNIKQEAYPGGIGQFSVLLAANQKCQFNIGAWTNAAGAMEATIGSINESSGTTVKTALPPVITIRRIL